MFQNEIQKREIRIMTGKPRRSKLNCKYWKYRGSKTHYCTIDENDKLKRCYKICNKFKDRREIINYDK
jgi:hypothetical protein